MDTKSKKSRPYSGKLKFLAVLVIILCAIASFCCGQFLLGTDYSQGISAAMYDSYFDTEVFSKQYSQLVRDAINVHLVYQSEANIREGNALQEERFINEFANIYGIEQDAIVRVRGDGAEGYGIDITKLSDVSRYNEYVAALETYFPAFYKRAIQEQITDFKQSQKELESFTNFTFYMVNDETGEYFGNRSGMEYIRAQKISTSIYGDYVDGYAVRSDNYYYSFNETGSYYEWYYYDNYQNSIFQILRDSGFTFYCAVMQPLQPGDNFYTQKQSFDATRASVPVMIGVIIGCSILSVALAIYLIYTAGRTYPGSPIRLWGTDYIHNDIHFILLMGVAVVSVGLAGIILGGGPYEESWSYLWNGVLGTVYVIDVLAALNFLLSAARQAKAKRFWHNTMVAQIFRWFASLFSSVTFRGWSVFILLVYGLINGLLGIWLVERYWDPMFVCICIVVFNVVAAGLYVRSTRSLGRIMTAARNISSGRLDQQLDMAEISATFQPMAKDVIGIQTGMRQAVAEAVKGERMKADLVTNVSHDLKTPLTSIITYVDLLKKVDLQNPVAQSYVDVLDEKSYRLKQLIEDLIEASKASSGNVKVEKHRLNLRELVLQATGEFEEKLEENHLQLVVGDAGEDVYVWADGKHLWRIAENILSNVVKYAMPRTRVYVDIQKKGDMGVFSVKNVSAQQITISTERLAERFIRGDQARTTEGSGLGLAITQSLTEIQGGKLDVDVDGDLFKISVKLPLWTEQMDD